MKRSLKNGLKMSLGEEDFAKYGNTIREEAQSFSKRARLTLTFLDRIITRPEAGSELQACMIFQTACMKKCRSLLWRMN